jgi:F-box and WD-40 domain protein CDC4
MLFKVLLPLDLDWTTSPFDLLQGLSILIRHRRSRNLNSLGPLYELCTAPVRMASSPTPMPWASVETPKHTSVPAHGTSVVTYLELTEDRIITASDDHTILIHSLSTCELLLKLEGHGGGVWSMDIFQDILVTGSTDRTIRVWDISTGKCLHVFGGHSATVRALVIAEPRNLETEKDGVVMREKWPKYPLIVSGSRDRSLRVWNLPSPADAEFKCIPDGQQVDDRHVVSRITQ